MNRDGALQSIWQTESAYIPQSAPAANTVYDALVIGGGITGLTTALLLAEQGQKVIVAEAHNLGWGTTGGTTAHLNTLLDTTYKEITDGFGEDAARQIYESTQRAIAQIRTLADRYGIADADIESKDGYLFAETEEEVKTLDETADSARKAGIDITPTDAIPVPVPFVKAVRFSGQGQFHVTRYLKGLARAFESLGGVIVENSPIGTISGEDVLEAETLTGVFRAKKAVWATHIPPGVNLLHFRNAPYRSYAMALRLANESQLSDAVVYDSKDPYYYYRTQELNGQRYLIAGGCDHKTGHNDNTQYVFTELEAYLRRYFDIAEVAFQWSSQYYVPADGLPYIGVLPGHEKQYCATGFNGNGMIFGTVSGMLLADLLTEKENKLAGLVSPSRIKPIAGFTNFIKENADVVKEFIGRRFAYETISELADLAPGEGRLVEYEDKKMALYKDEAGRVIAISPVCTHAGCIVAWNDAEKSWDCPCHGGRFSPDGEVITGPPRARLEKIALGE